MPIRKGKAHRKHSHILCATLPQPQSGVRERRSEQLPGAMRPEFPETQKEAVSQTMTWHSVQIHWKYVDGFCSPHLNIVRGDAPQAFFPNLLKKPDLRFFSGLLAGVSTSVSDDASTVPSLTDAS